MDEQQNSGKTPGKGTGRKPPPVGRRWTSDNQPSGQSKSWGAIKKKQGRELIQALMNMKFVGAADGILKKKISHYFGVTDPDELTFQQVAIMRQIEKAVSQSDTNALNHLLDRFMGKPTQMVTLANPDGESFKIDQSNTVIDFTKLDQNIIDAILGARKANGTAKAIDSEIS